jgi:cell division protein FtsL
MKLAALTNLLVLAMFLMMLDTSIIATAVGVTVSRYSKPSLTRAT